MLFTADKNRIAPVDSFYVWRVLLKIFKLNDLLKKISFSYAEIVLNLHKRNFEMEHTLHNLYQKHTWNKESVFKL